MEVQLFVYDLSKGLARLFSAQFLGTQIDAVYHTSVVLGGIEYFFGAGVQTCYPGATHHGAPIEVISFGTTSLPIDIILEYLDSLKQIYTPESYDLFLHNCNNFSNDFTMFLVGKGIPEHITSLPQTVLNTPFGQMLQPQLDSAMRTITQANIPSLQARTPVTTQSNAQDHPHLRANAPTFLRTRCRAVTYTKIPPLDKLTAKMGPLGINRSVTAIRDFITARNAHGANEAPLPDLTAFAVFLQHATRDIALDILFTAYDLLRVSLVDPRVSGFFAEEYDSKTIRQLIRHVNDLGQNCPYSLRLITLHMACNLFTSPLYPKFMLKNHSFCGLLTQLVASSLLDDTHSNIRIAASSLAFNMATANHQVRMEERHDALPEADQVELLAAMVEALGLESESKEAVKGLILAIGFLVYCAPVNGELLDLCKALDASGSVLSKEKLCGHDPIVREVGQELLG